MKKLLVVLLALTFVVAIYTVAFAVTTTTADGKVEWTMTSSDQFGGTDDGKVIFQLGKDFGEGYTAGLDIAVDPDNAPTVTWNCDGWIQMVKDLYTVKFQTGGLGGNAANELGVGYDMAGNAGLQVTSDKLMEGLALTLVLNDNVVAGPMDVGENADKYNYLIKAVYSADPLNVGFGYQMHTQSSLATDSAAKDAMALWAGYKLSDALSFGFEYGSRPNENGYDKNLKLIEGSTAILLKADYTADALTVNGKVLMTTGSYYLIDPDDVGTTSAWNTFKIGMPKNLKADLSPSWVDPQDGTGTAGTAIKVDASYKLTDALSVGATVEMIMDGANASGLVDVNCEDDTAGPGGTDPTPHVAVYGELADDALTSYKLSVTDQMSEQLKLEGWYAGYGPISEIGGKATYTFVAGLEGSLELKSVTTEGVDDPANSYTAKIVATL